MAVKCTQKPAGTGRSRVEAATTPTATSGFGLPGRYSAIETRAPTLGGTRERTAMPSPDRPREVVWMAAPSETYRTGKTIGAASTVPPPLLAPLVSYGEPEPPAAFWPGREIWRAPCMCAPSLHRPAPGGLEVRPGGNAASRRCWRSASRFALEGDRLEIEPAGAKNLATRAHRSARRSRSRRSDVRDCCAAWGHGRRRPGARHPQRCRTRVLDRPHALVTGRGGDGRRSRAGQSSGGRAGALAGHGASAVGAGGARRRGGAPIPRAPPRGAPRPVRAQGHRRGRRARPARSRDARGRVRVWRLRTARRPAHGAARCRYARS